MGSNEKVISLHDFARISHLLLRMPCIISYILKTSHYYCDLIMRFIWNAKGIYFMIFFGKLYCFISSTIRYNFLKPTTIFIYLDILFGNLNIWKGKLFDPSVQIFVHEHNVARI